MILKICVVIPTYDNARTISEVVKDVVISTPFPVLVVDDGSETPVTNCLYSWEVRKALETGRVRVERLTHNQGKGSALRFAIHKLAREGFTHMMAVDGDGQHLAREIHKLVDLAKQNPWDLIIGDRKLKSETVPGISKFGRRFSNFWVQYETGLHIKDSQSGFRLYPLLPVQNMRFYSSKYDFEIEVLIRLLWKGVQVREVEIDVHYPEPGERVTHFHKFWDNVRISLLNVLLVCVSLLRTHGQPLELANAIGLGVFIGCTPLYGFHTLIAFAVAFLFRLNAIALWIGTHVSTPLIAPFLIYAEIYVGKNWLNLNVGDGAKGELLDWVAGSLVTGVGLGIATWAFTWAMASYFKHRRKSSNWSGRTRGGRIGNGILKRVLQWLGLDYGYFCLRFIVPYFYLSAPKAWLGLNEYWQLVQPTDSFWRRQRRILHHYYLFGQVLMDRVFQGFHSTKQFSTVPDGMHNILSAMKEKQGLIMLSAHMGGWDLAAALLPTNGFSDHIHVVEFKSDGLTFQKIKENRDPQHLKSLDTNQKGDAIFEIHSALKAGGCLGLMGDRPLGDRFELIPFLGRLAPFDMTAFRLAAATRTPLLFTFGFKASKDTYHFFARPARRYEYRPDSPRELQCIEWATEYVREIEIFLRRYPDQWFNFYAFWSALPTAPNGALGSLTNTRLLEDLDTPSMLKPESEPDATPSAATEPKRSQRQESTLKT